MYIYIYIYIILYSRLSFFNYVSVLDAYGRTFKRESRAVNIVLYFSYLNKCVNSQIELIQFSCTSMTAISLISIESISECSLLNAVY